ncbi:MAG: hypothetical protein SGI77_21800 [Pirellulaceae bacterium]|nr:hypothetical protein [Pirellulaceae bacterium]
MSTTLEVTYDGTVSVQPITHAICRIGSNPSLELCITGIADHAATLRIQNGKRSIYNRSSSPISVGGKRVLPDQTLPWSEGQLLQLSDGVQLKLLNDKLSGASSIANRREGHQALSAKDSNIEATSTSEKKQSRMIIAGFMLVFATILFSSESNVADQAMNEEFSKVVEGLLVAEQQPNAGCYQQLRIDLQNAMLQDDNEQKSKLVSSVIGVLRSKRSVVEPKIDSQVERFVRTFL